MNEREGDYIHVLTRVRSHLPLEGGYWNHGSDKSLPVVQYTNPWYGHMSTDSTTLPFGLMLSIKSDISTECVQYGPCNWFCQSICKLFLGVDVFSCDIALLNLFMKPIILGKKMTVLTCENALISAGDSCCVVHIKNGCGN